MVEFYLLMFPRFPLRKKEHKSYFGKNRTHDFRTSRCAAYLLDHSGDELAFDRLGLTRCATVVYPGARTMLNAECVNQQRKNTNRPRTILAININSIKKSP